MARIVTLLSSIACHRLQRALHLDVIASHEVVHSGRAQELFDRLHSSWWDLVVLDPASVEPSADLAHHTREVALLLYGLFSPRDVGTVARWAVDCATTSVHTMGVDDDPLSLLRTIHELLAGARVDAILGPLFESIDGAAAEYLRLTLRATHRPLSVEELSRRVFCSPRTLRRRFAEAGLASPRSVIALCRLLRAAALMRTGTRSVASTARVLGFGTSENLCHHFARHLGCTPTALSHDRALERVIDGALAALAVQRSG